MAVTTRPAASAGRSRILPAAPGDPFDLFAVDPAPPAPPLPPKNASRAARAWRALSKRLRRMHQPRGFVPAARRLLVEVIWPLRAIVMAAKQTMQFGRPARRAGGPTPVVQFLQQLSLCVRTQLWPADYYGNRLFLPQRWRIADHFLTSEQALMVLWAMSPEPERSTLNDKRTFQAAAARLGLPHAAIVASFEGGRAVEGSGPASLPRADLFVKWNNLFAGRGVQSWRWDAAGQTYERDGQRFTPEQLWSQFERESGEAAGRTLIVQRRVENHPALQRYSSASACTARIVTARARGGEPHVVGAILRMPARGSVVDNLGAGGIAAPIDLATGRLGPAFGKDATHPDDLAHPDTGEPIAGRTTPHWPEAIALVRRAHRCFPQTGSIGWDVAFTPEGPLLIEANTGWGSASLQQQCCLPLPATILTPMVRTYLAEWREIAPAPPWAAKR